MVVRARFGNRAPEEIASVSLQAVPELRKSGLAAAPTSYRPGNQDQSEASPSGIHTARMFPPEIEIGRLSCGERHGGLERRLRGFRSCVAG